MSAAEGLGGQSAASRQADPVLRRMPMAFWRSLPVLLASGCALLVPTLIAGAIFGADSPVVALAVCLFGAPLLLTCVERLHSEVFERTGPRPAWWRRALRAEAIVLPCGLAAALSLVAAFAAAQSGATSFAIAATAGSLATVVFALVAIVALPLADARPESSLRAIVLVACYSVLRFPLPAIATAIVGCALAWVGMSGLPGLTALAPGLLAALAVGAAWPTVVRAGVSLPALAPLFTRTTTTFDAKFATKPTKPSKPSTPSTQSSTKE